MHIKALLSNGKDKLDSFLAEYRRDNYRQHRTNLFNRGSLGKYFAVMLLVIAGVWFLCSLF